MQKEINFYQEMVSEQRLQEKGRFQKVYLNLKP